MQPGRSCACRNRGGTERGVTGWPVTRQSEAPHGTGSGLPEPRMISASCFLRFLYPCVGLFLQQAIFLEKFQ